MVHNPWNTDKMNMHQPLLVKTRSHLKSGAGLKNAVNISTNLTCAS